MPEFPVQTIVRAGLEIPAEHGSHAPRGVEQRDALGTLGAGVPARQEVRNGWEEGALAEPDQEPHRVQLRHGGDGGGAEGEDGPQDLERRDEVRRADLGDEDDGGELAEDVARGEDVGCIGQVIALHVDGLLEARDVGVAQVGLIDALAEVGEAGVGQEEAVEFEEELLLGGGLVRVVPDVALNGMPKRLLFLAFVVVCAEGVILVAGWPFRGVLPGLFIFFSWEIGRHVEEKPKYACYK